MAEADESVDLSATSTDLHWEQWLDITGPVSTRPSKDWSVNVTSAAYFGTVNFGPLGGYTYTSPTTTFISNGIPTVFPQPKLTPVQVQKVLDNHAFVAEDGQTQCLICRAVDLWRTIGDHQFVIREE